MPESTAAQSNPQTYDVTVIGAGPVGLMTARLLGLRGHHVHVVERWPRPYPKPRAVVFDHEIGRVFQRAQLADQVRAISERVPDHYEWRNRHGEALVRIDWSGDGPSGWPLVNFFSQPDLERLLEEAVSAMPTVTVTRSRTAVDLLETDEHIDVTVADPAGTRHVLRSQYVIGCDGANSFVRQHMNTSITDLGFYFDWLIVDTIPKDDLTWSPMNWQLCDPRRPTTIVSGGPRRRRWEFMRLPHENPADLNTVDTAWRLLADWGRTPDNTELERHAVYTFQARWADDWATRRLLLAGDAAHLMPPFAGQGMCSGIRDAANLAWKLDLILRGMSQPDLLTTYTSERSAHLQHAIAMSVALGKTICVLDEDEAAERDRRMISAGALPRTALPPMPPERLGVGAWDTEHTPEPLQGTLVPQFRVRETSGRNRLIDDVIGSSFTLISYRIDPTGQLTERQRDQLTAADVRIVVLTSGDALDAGTPTTLMCDDAATRDYFEGNGIAAILVRPDCYLYGAVRHAGELGSLIDRLAEHLTLVPGDDSVEAVSRSAGRQSPR